MATRSQPDPPLLHGIVAVTHSSNTTFKERLADQFPIWCPEAALISALARNHFEIMGAEPPKRGAHYTAGELVCRKDAYIYWTVDQDGRLASLNGDYFVTCL